MMSQNSFFICKHGITSKLEIFPLVKPVECFCQIAYWDAFNHEDENLTIGELTLRRDVVRDFLNW